MPVYPDETTGQVHDRMKVLGAQTILKALPLIEKGPEFFRQEESAVSHAPKIFHEDCKIRFDLPGKQVYDFIRGMNPYPAPWTILDGKECKILEAELVDTFIEGKPGTIHTDNKKVLLIKTRDKSISVKRLKIAGKKAMSVHEYLSGHSVQDLSVGDQVVKM
jgi:methionyl-tRNA formyltransferase